jgi:peptidyl-prolyl cis-trans isomerase C
MERNELGIGLIAVLALGLHVGCNKGPGEPGAGAEPSQAPEAERASAVAKVGKEYVTAEELSDQLNKQPPTVRPIYTVKEKKKDYLNSVVRFELLALEARERGFDKDPEVQRIWKQQMVAKLQQQEYEPRMKADEIPDAEIQKYYDSRKNEFQRPDVIRASEIVVSSAAKAKQVAAAAAKLPEKSRIEGFRELVGKFSEDEAAKARGGDTAFFDRSSAALPRPVVEAAFGLQKVGDVSAPIKSDKGWHVILLTHKNPGVSKSLEDARAEIKQRLYYEHRNKVMDSVIANLRQKYGVELYEENLDKVVVDTGGGAGKTGQAAPAPAGTGKMAAAPATGAKAP